MTALLGTFVKINTMADGTPRIVLDMQCTLAEVAAMGLVPGVPFALARLEKEAATPAAEAPKGGVNAQWVAMRCAEPKFQAFLNDLFAGNGYPYSQVLTDEDAAEAVRYLCSVDSRAELDRDELAANRFHSLIRVPYSDWLKKNENRP